MPRSNRPRRRPAAGRGRRAGAPVPLDPASLVAGLTRREGYAGGQWFVRRVTGSGPGGPYRCPGCQQEVGGIPHVVVWPADGSGGLPGIEQRRHWHTGCWGARETRPPRGSYR